MITSHPAAPPATAAPDHLLPVIAGVSSPILAEYRMYLNGSVY